ncbi:hypothetical protein [Burkholderia ubonensis]|uniref:hypothetical protein n=1 Tax=Burkholderia ubonensis TaxID=101571 RepID=UPI0012FB5593|nr:hypothetical protein [Burkholderia ubonensis]
MKKISMLDAWLERTDPLHSFIDLESRPPNREFGGFLALDVVVPAHESLNLEAESLATSWHAVHDYVDQALSIIDADHPLWLDGEEVEMIRQQLGSPPPLCYPLYLISVGDGTDERLVYVGKTSSGKGRFKGGHAAFSKLLAPKFDGQPKRVYLAAIVLLSDDASYQPLEWVKPIDTAELLLQSIEAQLIYFFKPELNTQHVHKFNAKWPVSLHIQNFTGVTSFLDGKFCWP